VSHDFLKCPKNILFVTQTIHQLSVRDDLIGVIAIGTSPYKTKPLGVLMYVIIVIGQELHYLVSVFLSIRGVLVGASNQVLRMDDRSVENFGLRPGERRTALEGRGLLIDLGLWLPSEILSAKIEIGGCGRTYLRTKEDLTRIRSKDHPRHHGTYMSRNPNKIPNVLA
jgi:hypothetical protein